MEGSTTALRLGLRVLDWGAWAQDRVGKEAWTLWARRPPSQAPDPASLSGPPPAAAAVPAILRRRAGLSDRLALELACALVGKDDPVPGVFASRHGQIVRSVALLEALAQGAPLSPMDFSVSVHNATAGLFSIARGDRSATTAVAAGRESLSGALLEAAALLVEGADRVLVVYHDEAPPPVFDGRWEPEAADWALGLLLGRDRGRRLGMRLEDVPSGGADAEEVQALALARLLAKGEGVASWFNGRHLWTWELPG